MAWDWRSRHRSARLQILEEHLEVAEELQRRQAGAGKIPDSRSMVLRQMKKALEVLGGIAIGVTTSAFAVLACFIVINMILHLNL